MGGEYDYQALELRIELEYAQSVEEIMTVLDAINEYVMKKREIESQNNH